MIWKFFTEACVTRPWKFNTYDWVCSFQLGDLFTKVTSLSVFPFEWRTSRVSSSWNKRECHLSWNILLLTNFMTDSERDLSSFFFFKQRLTFLGRMDTLSSFSSMPGMITVIFLGPLKPRTFVSWKRIICVSSRFYRLLCCVKQCVSVCMYVWDSHSIWLPVLAALTHSL